MKKPSHRSSEIGFIVFMGLRSANRGVPSGGVKLQGKSKAAMGYGYLKG